MQNYIFANGKYNDYNSNVLLNKYRKATNNE